MGDGLAPGVVPEGGGVVVFGGGTGDGYGEGLGEEEAEQHDENCRHDEEAAWGKFGDSQDYAFSSILRSVGLRLSMKVIRLSLILFVSRRSWS